MTQPDLPDRWEPLTDFAARPSYHDDDDRLQDSLSALSLPLVPARSSRIRVIATGIPKDVTAFITRLDRCGIPRSSWSRAQAIPASDEVVRICMQQRSP